MEKIPVSFFRNTGKIFHQDTSQKTLTNIPLKINGTGRCRFFKGWIRSISSIEEKTPAVTHGILEKFYSPPKIECVHLCPSQILRCISDWEGHLSHFQVINLHLFPLSGEKIVPFSRETWSHHRPSSIDFRGSPKSFVTGNGAIPPWPGLARAFGIHGWSWASFGRSSADFIGANIAGLSR